MKKAKINFGDSLIGPQDGKDMYYLLAIEELTSQRASGLLTLSGTCEGPWLGTVC